MDRFVRANRDLWDEWTAIHERSRFYDLEGFRRGGIRIHDVELAEVGDVRGRDLLHLQCHFGIDTLSWARLGARVTGVDFSEPAVELARRLAEELGLEARFLRSDVLELDRVLEGDFDVVYSSWGFLGWLPDVPTWARVAAGFVRPGGFLYIAEMHPALWPFDEDADDLLVRWPYFAADDPLAFPVRGSYADPDAPVSVTEGYAWAHPLGEVVTCLIEAGLRIDFLHEFDFLPWATAFLRQGEDGLWRLPPERAGQLPLSFSLRASKPLGPG